MVANLKMLRERKGLTQQQLAKMISVSQQSINRYEHRETNPSIEILRRLADALETSVDFLIGHTTVDCKVIDYTPISLDEVGMMEEYRKMNDAERQFFLETLKAFKNNIKDKDNKN